MAAGGWACAADAWAVGGAWGTWAAPPVLSAHARPIATRTRAGFDDIDTLPPLEDRTVGEAYLRVMSCQAYAAGIGLSRYRPSRYGVIVRMPYWAKTSSAVRTGTSSTSACATIMRSNGSRWAGGNPATRNAWAGSMASTVVSPS